MGAEAWALLGLFSSAFLAATVLPAASEPLLVGLLIAGTSEPWRLIGVATLGNTLGSALNWWLGRFLFRYRDSRWFPVPPASMATATRTFRRWGLWSLLFAWLPVVGDALTVAAGLLRVRFAPFLLLVAVGKLARYAAAAGATVGVFG